MNEYKKALIEIRNSYIAQKNKIVEKKEKMVEESFEKQTSYLNSKSFNLISRDNYILSIIGNFIVYVLMRKKTENDLMQIVSDDIDELEKLILLEKKYDMEYKKIMKTIDFITSVDEAEFNKLVIK